MGYTLDYGDEEFNQFCDGVSGADALADRAAYDAPAGGPAQKKETMS